MTERAGGALIVILLPQPLNLTVLVTTVRPGTPGVLSV